MMNTTRCTTLVAFFVSIGLLLVGCSPATDIPEVQGTEPGQAHSPEELQQALEEFAEGRSGARILSDHQLRDSIPAAEAWLSELEVNPEECGLSLTSSLGQQLEHASMAALQLGDSFITLASYPDAGQLAASFEAEEQRSERCARYTVLRDGQHVAFHLAAQGLQTEARKSAAHVLTSSDGSAASQQVMVKAANGNVMITINQPLDKESRSEQFASLSEQVNDLLEVLG
ncbi:hypothetical protein OK351_06995 [Glutamicibacter sp. MNS18]|uniref:hypothetical protein n=1 Tax=Glutamicibacter sp. MNS18 TaxID=2989817 RepID=UPI0022366EB4|nr:hypothetical protein [Glutamicibacter sp. MNS18]MCW4465247.1 hypothetical protein [Glutamicibacter sp. MNS18]